MSKQYIALEDGNQISYQSYGNGENVILFYHGLVGGAWLGDDWKDAIEKNNVQLIALERSGYGSSSKIEMESVSQWISIAWQIAKALNIQSADVIGCSAGAPYAYATAYALPDIIKKVWILGGVPAVYEDWILKHYSAENQVLYRTFITKKITEVQDDYIKQLSTFKQHIKENDEDYIKNTVEEILKQQCFGMAQECRLQILPWQFPLSDIRQPVIVRHAVTDEMVPYNAVKEMQRFFKNYTFKDIEISGEDVHRSSITKAFFELLNEYN